MAARRMMLPDYGTVSMKGTQYYRTRVTDQQGRRVSLYARTREELYQKEQEAIQQIENKTYRRSTYITNLIHASVDPKTVQYLAGHESSKITMDIYAKVKYNRPEQLAGVLEDAFASWD